MCIKSGKFHINLCNPEFFYMYSFQPNLSEFCTLQTLASFEQGMQHRLSVDNYSSPRRGLDLFVTWTDWSTVFGIGAV